MVYELRKTTVYHQVYRHQTVALVSPSETTVAIDFCKTKLFQRLIAILRRSEHPLHIPRNYIESGRNRFSHKAEVSAARAYTVRNTVMSRCLQRDINRRFLSKQNLVAVLHPQSKAAIEIKMALPI